MLTWYVEPNAISKWKREPVSGFTQVGYIPQQEKLAGSELDMNDTPLRTASLFRVAEDGKFMEKLHGEVKVWGKYLRYNYAKFDFSSVREPGIYFIQNGGHKTNISRY